MIVNPLPSISIVVPNYNGAATLERTLRSLIDQQYPALEIIVIDGGSSDDSINIIKQYEKQLAYWVSEEDRGQSDAINKGFARCKGEVVNWLCSDDVLLPGALEIVGRTFAENPGVDVVTGGTRVVYTDDRQRYMKPWVHIPTPELIRVIPCAPGIGQPACFYRRSLLGRSGPLRTDLFYTMDTELWCHFNQIGARWYCLAEELAIGYESGSNKTSTGKHKISLEVERIYRQYFPERISLMFWQRHVRNPFHIFLYRHREHRQIWRLRRWFDRLENILGKYYDLEKVKALDWRWYYIQ